MLQLAETLRKSMQLRSAQIWTGADGHYEIAAMVPYRPYGEPFSIPFGRPYRGLGVA